MFRRSFGVVLIAAACFAAGLGGIAGFWAATEARVPGTSPLAQLFTCAWSITYILAGVLTWRRSRFAPYAWVAALGLLVFLLWQIVPNDRLLLLGPLVLTALAALFGYRYLRRQRQRLA